MKWQEIKLEEIADFRNGLNYTKNNNGEGLKVVNVKDFQDLMYLNYDSLEEINPAGLPIDKSLLEENDILFVRSNGNKDLVGRSVHIIHPPENLSFSGFCIRLRFKKSTFNTRFYAYFFRSPLFRKKLSLLGSGTNISNLNQKVLNSLYVPIPLESEQNKIADILSRYDETIANNRRRIELLERSSRLLYREWFVYLRFPGHEHGAIGSDGIPEGWEYLELGDLVLEIIDYRGKTPKKLGSDWSSSGIAALSALNVKNNQLVNLDKCKYVDENLYEKWMKSELRESDILLTSEAPLGEVCYLGTSRKFCLSQRLYAIRANPEVIKPAILGFALLSPVVQGEILARQTGTTVFGIRQTALRKVPILIPPISLQEAAASTLDKNIAQKEVLLRQNQKLQAARDLLLPRLMNGEINV